MFHKALRDLLVADANVTGKIATYEFTTGAAETPAVFTDDVAPGNAEGIFIVVTTLDSDNFGTRARRGGEVWIDVNLWGDKGRSDLALWQAADAAWKCLDRAMPVVTGWNMMRVVATPPQRITDVDGFPGYLLRCHTLGTLTT